MRQNAASDRRKNFGGSGAKMGLACSTYLRCQGVNLCLVCATLQVSPGALKLILDYCRFHRVPGRSDKERKVFDEKFVRLDTRRLCELTSAADSLDMKPLGDLTSRALARMIEGKTPEQIREIFHLPDDLTEEEKLEPVKISTDDPRIRLLNRLYARKRKELQEKKLLKSGLMESGQKQVRDERSVEDLVSFIDGENKNNRLGKGKRKKNRRKKETTEENSMSRPRTDASRAAVNEKLEKEKAVQLSTMGRTASRAGGGLENSIRIVSKVQDKVFEEAEFDDDDDDFDPALKEIVDREVEDFARRLNSDWLNSDWLKRTQEILTLASSSQEHRISELSGTSNSAASNVGDRETSFYKEGHMGNGHTVCSLPKDKRIIQL
jgi:S-phase kinase-associated protein 1